MNWGGYVALLADCHIDASPTRVVRQIYHLREDQMAWLARTLDAALSVPTMLFMHPHPSPNPEDPRGGTLADTNASWT